MNYAVIRLSFQMVT